MDAYNKETPIQAADAQPHKYISSQGSLFAELSLALFVLRILANYSDTAFSLDDFALFANRLYR